MVYVLIQILPLSKFVIITFKPETIHIDLKVSKLLMEFKVKVYENEEILNLFFNKSLNFYYLLPIQDLIIIKNLYFSYYKCSLKKLTQIKCRNIDETLPSLTIFCWR